MNEFDDGIWMPCLGRDLKLGTLYDCCTDDIVIGSSIWDEKTIHEAEIQLQSASKQIPIECTVCTPHNISKKASCLGINEELYLSCAAGHIKLEGEAVFFNDNVSSKNVIRIALKCHNSSRVIQLNKSKLNSVNIETFEQDHATHVITAVECGAISIIVLYQKTHEKCGIKATDENLKTKANYLQRRINGNCHETFDMESNSENITCRIYSTLHITNKTESFSDAVKLCEELFKLHTDHSNHKPIRVSLSPLKKINKRFTKQARNINDIELINQVKCIHDIIIDIALYIKDLKANVGIDMIPCITEQIESCSKSNDKLQSEFSKTLDYMIPKYRKGDIEESLLDQKVKSIVDNCKKLHTFVQNKSKEVHQICIFMKALKDYDLISEVSEVSLNYKYIICLEFNTCHLTDFELASNISPWYQDKRIIAGMRQKIRQFLNFAKENSTKEDIKFAISEFSDKKCSELVMIRLYYDNEILLFDPPTPPSKPIESQKSESSITLTWSEPQHGAQFIDSYCVYICKAEDDKWISCPTVKCTNGTAIIEKLEANTRYLFKVSATTKIHTTIESQISEVICTPDHDNESSESKTKSKKVSKPSKSGNTLSNDQVIPANNKTNTVRSCKKGTTSNERQDSKATESDTASPVTETHSQNAMKKGVQKGSATHAPTNNATPKGSVIQQLYQTNKCERLKGTSPSLYTLNITNVYMKHVESELYSFGKINQLPEKVILLVGATGAGKTTLINGMINYIFGVKWEDSERIVLVEGPSNKKGASQANSQTICVNIYKISHSKYDRLSYNLTIIDTPGFADTDGLSKDQTIMTKIQTLLTSDKIIDHIDGIGFVVQAPLSRLTPTQGYVINSVYSLFGHDVANNIFVLVTFSDPVSPPHVKSALDETNIQYNAMFKFNNSALYANMSKRDKNSLNKLLWEMGMESFDTFFKGLENIDPVSLTLTKDVLNERRRLQILLEGLQTQIENEFMNMQKLEHEERMLTKCKNEIEKNENFEYQSYVKHKKLVQVPLPANNCCQCQITCHKICTESSYNGGCYVMVWSFPFTYKCGFCKCPLEMHKISNFWYHDYYEFETKTIKPIKQKYDKAQNAQIDIVKIIKDINCELEMVRKAASEKLSEIHKCIQRINEISLRPDLITEVDYIKALIASERAEQTEGYITRLGFYDKILKELAIETQV